VIGKLLPNTWKSPKQAGIIKQKDKGSEMKRVAFIQSGSGTLTLLLDKEAHTVAVDHPNFGRIMQVLDNRDADELLELVNVSTSIESYTEGKIKIQEGLFLYDGYELHNALTERIMKLMAGGHTFDYMVKFLDNLMDNPSGRATQELYNFLEHRSLPITEDGCFLAYKSVREDYMDWYSNSIDNNIGKTVSIPRNRVDDNCDRGCSYGLHVGAMDYVGSYHSTGGNIIIVKVNPKDCVSVPLDSNHTKLRVCSYEVVDHYDGDLEEVIYRTDVGNVEEMLGTFDQNMADHWYSYEQYDNEQYDNEGDA
jgi:hypothetical protein